MDIDSIWIPVLIVGIIALLSGILLTAAAVIMHVKKDEKIQVVIDILPGANCGGCGYPGCEAYAAAIVDKGEKHNRCAPGGGTVSARIDEVFGQNNTAEGDTSVRMVALVRCSGGILNTSPKMIYRGIPTCTSASMYYGGTGKCPYGCMGFGDCMNSCVFDAISISGGIAHVDREKCTGCGICVKTCPKHVISLVPFSKNVSVICNNKDKGAKVRKDCAKGCLGCGLCARSCEHNAITISDNLARINDDLCVGCFKCTTVCPSHGIICLHND